MGSAVVRAARHGQPGVVPSDDGTSAAHRPLGAADPPRLRLVRHASPVALSGDDLDHEVVSADLTLPQTVLGLCDGVDAVVHCASWIGADIERCTAVNVEGTRALLAEARRAGVRRFVMLSTASVYGRGVFRNAPVAGLRVNPGSATSRSRARAEREVLAGNGTVLRPHLVLGHGDRWVAPGLAALDRRLGADVAWTTSHSVIDVAALGRLLLATALSLTPKLRGSAFHANHPEPATCGDLISGCRAADAGGWPPGTEVSLSRARVRLADDPTSLHHLDLISTHHWFDSSEIWRLTGCRPGPPYPEWPSASLRPSGTV